MAGGKGSRMGGVEKPLIPLKGKPLISYVIASLLGSKSVGTVYTALSPNVPATMEYVKNEYEDEKRVSAITTPGAGYVEDMAFTVKLLGMYRPVLIISSDVPLISPEDIDYIIDKYNEYGKEAMSVRVSLSGVNGLGINPDIVLYDSGIETVPCGINIIDGSHIDRAQDEAILIVNDPRLAVNINYKKDIEYCKKLLPE